MSWPTTFGTLTSPVPASLLDTMFNQVAAGMEIPCSVIGTNALSLTPLPNFPALTSYNELGGYRFRAATNSTGPVTAQYNGMTFLPAYHADGVTQVSTGDIVANFEYVLRFSQALNGGTGGFFLESPAIPNAATNWFTPGGRLTTVAGTPVNFVSAGSVSISYSPYVHAFAPIYNGTSIQIAQFTSGLSDPNGLTLNIATGAIFTANTAFDVFIFLNAGVPTLCCIPWTNLTTRSVGLAVWGGFLTNNATAAAYTSGGSSFTLQVHQGTFLGSFMTHPGIANNTQWIFPGSASGGTLGLLQLCNYYNKVPFAMVCVDTGSSYTYVSATVRQARGSINNAIDIFTCDSERPVQLVYMSGQNNAAVANGGSAVGIAIDSTTGFNALSQATNPQGVNGFIWSGTTYVQAALTGFHAYNAVEQGDGGNANTFDRISNNSLYALAYL